MTKKFSLLAFIKNDSSSHGVVTKVGKLLGASKIVAGFQKLLIQKFSTGGFVFIRKNIRPGLPLLP